MSNNTSRRTEPLSNVELFTAAVENCDRAKEALQDGQFAKAITHFRKAASAAEALACRAAGNKIPKIGD